MGTGGTKAKLEYNAPSFKAQASGQFSDDPQRSHMEMDCSTTYADMTFEFKTSDFIGYGVSSTAPLIWGEDGSSFLKAATDIFVTLDDRARYRAMLKAEGSDSSEFTLAASTGLGPDQVSATYTQKMGAHMTLLTEANFSFAPEKQTRRKEWVSIKSTLDTAGTVAVIVEEPLSDFVLANFSYKGNPLTNEYDVGVGCVCSF